MQINSKQLKENDIVIFTPVSASGEWLGMAEKSWNDGELVVCNLVDPDEVYELDEVKNLHWVGSLYDLKALLDFQCETIKFNKIYEYPKKGGRMNSNIGKFEE